MARVFKGRVSEVAELLVKIGGKAQTNIMNLVKIQVNLEFIGLLQGSEPPDLPTETKKLRRRRIPIYDACNVFGDLLASVRMVLEIPEVSTSDVEADVADGDDAEVGDDDVMVDDDEEIEN
ncbi:hypothetical protein AALP_AA7G118900 [Arabis alpina]|uniref:Uncharacterized protein n=1 Tax=Arabis alpina TaxID=50452 RepID=A0A087GHH4_ARAAL|nr:hypothetical protein AALP_AA7G118900 [Arabis alpina]